MRKCITLEDALKYHELGLAVVPAAGKRPSVKWRGFQQHRPSESQLRQWFGGDDQVGIAVILGDVSGGIVCRDFDDLKAYDRWAAEHPDLASTLPTVETPRPGRHVYAKIDANQIKATGSRGGSVIFAGDGELRGGGICLLPPSLHPDGANYRWHGNPPESFPVLDLRATGFLPCNRVNKEDGEDGEHVFGSLSPPGFSLLHGSETSISRRVEAAIARTTPERFGQRHWKLFAFARELKAIPEFAGAGVIDLKPYVRQWHEASIVRIRTKPFEETWFEFAESWNKVKFPAGQDPIQILFARVRENDLPDAAKQYETIKMQLLVALCRELQRNAGDQPFYLAARTAGELIGVEHTVAWRWLRGFQVDGILRLVSTGSRAKHRANRYRYLKE